VLHAPSCALLFASLHQDPSLLLALVTCLPDARKSLLGSDSLVLSSPQISLIM
jgi:hypothetical protein